MAFDAITYNEVVSRLPRIKKIYAGDFSYWPYSGAGVVGGTSSVSTSTARNRVLQLTGRGGLNTLIIKANNGTYTIEVIADGVTIFSSSSTVNVGATAYALILGGGTFNGNRLFINPTFGRPVQFKSTLEIWITGANPATSDGIIYGYEEYE